jgi:hypothetical protein
MLGPVNAPAAGWFVDPAGRGGYRWWNGTAWTRYLTDDPTMPPPTERQAVRSTASSAAEPSTVMAGAASYPPGYERTPKPRTEDRRIPWLRQLIAIVGVVLLASVGAVIVVEQRNDQLLLPPAAGTPSAKTYDEATRTLKLPGLELTMPGRPYTVEGGDTLSGFLIGGAEARATVQDDPYVEARIDVGQVAERLVGGSTEETAELLFDAATNFFFEEDRKISKRSEQTVSENLPYPVRIITARVRDSRSAKPGYNTKYETVSVLVAPREDGGYNGWIATRPDNAGADVVAAHEECTSSIILE